MNMSDLIQVAAQSFIKSDASGSAGSKLDAGALGSKLAAMLGGDTPGSGIDLGRLVQQFNSGGLASAVQSWLGDGANQSIGGDQITNMFGTDKIAALAAQLGLNQNEVAGGLAEALPDMLDKGSRGGSLLDGLSGLSRSI
jgi:uncharacterized protein YidB (DUF937 family)